jgi:predicted transcriptional regulator YdeE
MKINTSYPYPVLYMNNEDYVNSSFHTTIQVQESFGEVKVNAEFVLDNNKMQRLIEEGLSSYLIHIECGHTSFRQVYKTQQRTLEIAIPTERLRGKIELHSFIIANQKIEEYTNDFLNDWFKEIQPISFEKGNLLAIGEAIETTLFEDHTEMLNIPSIVKVIKSLSGEFMEVDLHSNIITVSLPEYEYNQYATNANSRFKSTILSNVILPSLVYVFSRLKENREDLEEYTWYQVLEKIFDENNYRIDDVGSDHLSALKAAQLVLRKPLKTSFDEIEKLNQTED